MNIVLISKSIKTIQFERYPELPNQSVAASVSEFPVLRPSAAKPPMLMERTQPVLDKLSRALGEPIITYWNSNKGSICQNDVAGLYALLRKLGSIERLTLFVKSDGGSGQASLRMVNLLRRYVKHLTVPHPAVTGPQGLAFTRVRITMSYHTAWWAAAALVAIGSTALLAWKWQLRSEEPPVPERGDLRSDRCRPEGARERNCFPLRCRAAIYDLVTPQRGTLTADGPAIG